MKRCTLIIPDTRPFNSLWVADRLDLFTETRHEARRGGCCL